MKWWKSKDDMTIEKLRIETFGDNIPPPGYRYVQPSEMMGDPVPLSEIVGSLRALTQKCICCGGPGHEVDH